MALNGINMPLAFTGQEYVWRALFRELGITDSELAEWFTGPAFLAWFRMGNVQGWGGPMPAGWIDQQYALQLKILARERALGMTPVLPMFSGYVPKALKTHYPDAQITKMFNWHQFSEEYRTWNLEVTDPLFKTIGKRFLELQAKFYGTNHIYNADTYNEMVPPSSDPAYLRNSSRGVYEAMAAADPRGIWLMQVSSILVAFLRGKKHHLTFFFCTRAGSLPMTLAFGSSNKSRHISLESQIMQ